MGEFPDSWSWAAVPKGRLRTSSLGDTGWSPELVSNIVTCQSVAIIFFGGGELWTVERFSLIDLIEVDLIWFLTYWLLVWLIDWVVWLWLWLIVVSAVVDPSLCFSSLLWQMYTCKHRYIYNILYSYVLLPTFPRLSVVVFPTLVFLLYDWWTRGRLTSHEFWFGRSLRVGISHLWR